MPKHPQATVEAQRPLPRGHRAPPWRSVPDEQWQDWRWQLTHRLSRLEEFQSFLHLTPEEEEGIGAGDRLRLDLTPYFASLIDPDDPTCPIRRQVIPKVGELLHYDGAREDSLAEEEDSPVPGLVHRYPDRVLMIVTTQCASYCRYCTRSRIVGDPHANFSLRDLERQIAYVRRTPEVRDVLLSGGDPLLLAPKVLEWLLGELRRVPHVEIVRIGTRVPVFLPQRITADFVAMLARYHPLWMNIHVNHPKELSPEVGDALRALADAGIPLGAQTVLLRGINDHPAILAKLFRELTRHRVRPYYLYQCDLVRGAGHFRTTVAKGIEIMEALRGHLSGYAIPTYVVDAPGGGGKIPVSPNYVLAQAPGRVVLRNFEGYITAYDEPDDYLGPDMAVPPEWLDEEGGRLGVAGLLRGAADAIVPQGFRPRRAGSRQPSCPT